jgi:hypothetical protein
MTTVAAARTALVTAVSASEKETNGTACYVFSAGTDFVRLGGSSTEWRFRVTCAVGWNSDIGTMEGALATLVLAKVTIVNALAGWRLVDVGPSTSRQIAGGDHLAADIAVTTKVDI